MKILKSNSSSYFLLSIIIILFLCCLSISSEQHNDTDCKHQCGNIEIPYPFGIATGPEALNHHCFFDPNFGVSCNTSSSNQSIPYLKKLDLEIVEVRFLDNTVIVKFPSVTVCNGTEIHWSSPKLHKSALSFAESNVFASVGCHGYALFYTDKGETEGCTSVCAIGHQSSTYSANTMDNCYGFNNCCQIKVPIDRSYNITVTARNGTEHCRSAFLISREYLPNVSFTLSPMSTYPVMLSWPEDVSVIKKVIISVFMIVLAVPLVGLIILSCCIVRQCWRCKTKRKRKEIKLREKYFKGILKEQRFNQEVEKTRLFTKKEIQKATGNFNNNHIIGKGGQGTVYKGELSDGKLIAVKRSSSLKDNQWKEFINEVIILSQVNHRNVVKLLGCCLETKTLHLVYEFIPNGTLSELIHGPNQEFRVTWEIRLRIASEVAGAIAYLHSSSSTPIYHRDIKSCNILLDHKYTAKVCDFGISRSISMDQTHLTTCVRGTFGYLDPQYFRTRQFTEKSDVYSFGVVLVEILTGQRPICVTLDYATSLVMQFVETEDSALYEMLDPIILESGNMTEDIMVVVSLAKRCLHPEGALRPTMMQVAMELVCLSKKVHAKVATSSDLSQEFFSTKTHLDESCSF